MLVHDLFAPAGAAVGTTLLALLICKCMGRKAAKSLDGPQPAWEWFIFSNVVAVCAFLLSTTYLLNFWMTSARHAAPAYAFTNPTFTLSLVAAIGSLLYFFAFFGVAFIHADVTESLAPSTTTKGTQPAAQSTGGEQRAMNAEYDADVVIVGAGTAGAALATVLARDGKKVVLIERHFEQKHSVVGELLQPGGVRCLERMGLADCCKTPAVDCVHVEGYACMTPGSTDPSGDLILSYPSADPQTLAEQAGITPHAGPVATAGRMDARLKVHPLHAGAGRECNATIHSTSGVGGSAGPNTCPVTGHDLAPRGRSFHNHRFVHELRQAAMREPNVRVHCGRVKKVLTSADMGVASPEALARQAQAGRKSTGPGYAVFKASDRDQLQAIRTGANAAPLFPGWDASLAPLKADDPTAQARSTITPAAASSSSSSSSSSAAAKAKPAPPCVMEGLQGDADAVMGVAWEDETGAERVTTARLTILADGMFSSLRSTVHDKDVKGISHFCGLLLHHPPHTPPLPYPNRGHVIMADPNPVLLYQISPTETRVLVDVSFTPKQDDGSLRRYFIDVIAPQLPPVSRQAFIEAATTQEAHCMSNKALWATPTSRRGAVPIGDAWNMRHPLTGGGMTVALKDVEMLAAALRGVDMQSASWSHMEARIAAFQKQRQHHAATINVLACALHRVFTKPVGDDGTRDRLRAACIDYLSMGGACTAGPVGLLSGLVPRPGVLVGHFFAVAAHAMRRALLPFPTPTRLRQGYDLLHIACIIIMPMLAEEKVTLLSSAPVQLVTDLLFPWKKADLSKL